MKVRAILVLALTGLLLPWVVSVAADQESKQIKEQEKAKVQQQVEEKRMMYGWELMTVEERAKHRAKMQSFTTQEEREAYRRQHHERMQARAKEKGVTLPDKPRQWGNRGAGGGGGAGPGGGGGKNR